MTRSMALRHSCESGAYGLQSTGICLHQDVLMMPTARVHGPRRLQISLSLLKEPRWPCAGCGSWKAKSPRCL